ncbi:MAG: ABC transporter permease [Thermodesulfovibrionia bacterium]|nr:MAG: ABC transporter permease [Thermodesulfovibrionia bacterium]
MFTEISELYRYKELLRNLVSRDIKKRYKRSTLGFLWVMLDPLLMMLVFYIIFAGVFGRAVGNYTAYVISGITMWQLFAQGTKIASVAFISNRSLINKLYLPKSIFPVSVVVSSLVHFFFSLVPLFAIIILSGTQLSHNIVLLPLVVCLIFIFSLGISLTISTLAVFFHDVTYIYDVLLIALMYLSAIFYPVSVLPDKYQVLMSFNPIYHYISLFRASLYDNSTPMAEHFLWGMIFALISFLIGWTVYHKNKDRIIFYL